MPTIASFGFEPSVNIDILPTMHPALDYSTTPTPTSSPITIPNPNTDASSQTSNACHTIAMDRIDSGFGENPTTPNSSLSRASSIMAKERGRIRSGRPQQPRSRKDAMSGQSAANAVAPRGKHTFGSAGTASSEPTIPQRTSSQSKITTPNSYRSSKSLSRRSSFMTQRPTTHRKRRPIPNRSVSTTYARPVEDPILLYQRSKSLFESPHNGLDYLNRSETLSQEQLTPSLPYLPRASTTPAEDISQGLLANEEDDSSIAHQYSNHVPATIIDWTLPSTRRREYRKIESSSRGIPGLWRRFAPRFLQRNRRLSFYEDEKDDDTGSVRRYRVDLPGEDEKIKSFAKANGSRLSLDKLKRSWSCIGSFKKSA